MYAQIGTTIFQGLFSPENFTMDEAETYAKQALVQGKPRTQHVGSELREITLSIHLIAAFCTPDVEIAALRASMEAHTPLPFIKGTGEYLGDYLIESMSHMVLDAGPDGSTLEATVSLALVEYVDPNPATAGRRAAASAGFGMAANNPVALTRRPSGRSNSGKMLAELNASRVQSQMATANLAEAAAKPSRAARLIGKAKKAMAAAKEGMAKVQNILSTAAGFQNKAQSMQQQVVQARRNIDAALVALEPPVDLNDARRAADRVNSSLTNTSTAASPILALGGARKG